MSIGLGDIVRIKGTDAKGLVVRIRTELSENYGVVKVFEIAVTEGKMKGKTIQAKRGDLLTFGI